jgi:hypothetical protein
MTVPLQTPGGAEVLVILLIFLVPVAAIVLLVRFLRRDAGSAQEPDTGRKHSETKRPR